MATTINSYSVGLTLDASSYIDASKLTRSETKSLITEINKARDPAENFSRAQEKLDKALAASAITQEVYNRLLEASKEKYGINAEAAKEAAEQIDKLNALTRQGESVTKSLMTAEEQHKMKLRELKQLYDTQSIGLETYNRALKQAENALQSQNPEHVKQQRLLEEGRRLTQQHLMPLEKYANEQKRLNELLRAGAIDQNTYNRAIDAVKPKMEVAADATRNKVSTLERLSQMSNVVTGSITAARAAIDVFAGAKDQIDQITDRIADTADAARTLGLTFTELTSLRFAASQAGAGIESLEGAIKQMMKRGFAGDDVKESFLQIADEISGMASQTERMQRAYEVFGKQGADVLLMLQEGRDAIQENVEFADKWNRLTEGQVIGAEEYGDAIDRIGVVWSGIANIVGAELAPVITIFAEELLGVYDSWEDVEGVVQGAVDNVVYIAGWIKDIKDVTDLWVTSMYRVVTLDFSGLADDINEAFDFNTADEYLTRVQQRRFELEQKGIERTRKLEQEQEQARLQRIVDEQRQKKELAEKAIQDEAKLRADAEAKAQQEALKAEEQRQQQIQKMMEQSLNAASKKLEEEAKKAMAIQESIAKGPASFEVGSAGAAQYTAGLTNAALASTVMTDAIAPGEQALLDEAAKQFEQMVELNKKQAEQVSKLSELVSVTKENGFKRIR